MIIVSGFTLLHHAEETKVMTMSTCVPVLPKLSNSWGLNPNMTCPPRLPTPGECLNVSSLVGLYFCPVSQKPMKGLGLLILDDSESGHRARRESSLGTCRC